MAKPGRRPESWEMVNASLERTAALEPEGSGPGAGLWQPGEGGAGAAAQAHRLFARREMFQRRRSRSGEWPRDPIPRELRLRHGLPPLAEAFCGVSTGPGGRTRRRPCAPVPPRPTTIAWSTDRSSNRSSPGGGFGSSARGQRKAHRYRLDWRVPRKAAGDFLPFEPTAAQRRCFDEVGRDLKRPWPMRRLLHGDVGSGKTAVAAQAIAVGPGQRRRAAYTWLPPRSWRSSTTSTSRRFSGRRHPVRLRTVAGGPREDVGRRRRSP